MRLLRILCIGAALTTGFSVPVFAQFDTAEVLGTIRDRSDAVLSGATVTLLNQETGIEAKTTTGSAGTYTFPNVKIGVYTVTVEAAGFSKGFSKDVTVNINAHQRVDLALQVGAVTEAVEVLGAATALQTDSSERGQVIGTRAVVELPLNGRAYSDLALLTTGVLKSPSSASREGSSSVQLVDVDPAFSGLPTGRHEAACASGSIALLAASAVSAFLGDTRSFVVISLIVLMSVALDFVQEYRV